MSARSLCISEYIEAVEIGEGVGQSGVGQSRVSDLTHPHGHS